MYAGLWHAPDFLKLLLFVHRCVCLLLRALITSGIIQIMCDWLSLFYSYNTIAIDKVDEHGLSNTVYHRSMPGKEDKVDAVLAIETFKLLSSNNKTEHFSYKGEWMNAYQHM